MIPFRTPSLLTWLLPDLVWRMPSTKKEIFLTFDDGPVPGPTEFVLETLRKYNAKATFFCIGDNVRKHPEIFAKIVEADHAIGNHTFNHVKGWNCSIKNYLENVELCERQINPISNRQSLFRPPYGRITPSQINALKEKYKIIMWDVLTQDYSKSIRGAKCLSGSIRATRSGSVIVFHDSLKAERNLCYVLPKYLDHFTKQGFAFSTL